MSGPGGGWLDAAWLVEALIASTLLMGFVLAVRKPAQRAFGPQLAYWLWALPALRMAMPTLPAEWREQTIAPIAVASETVRVLIVPVTSTTADPAAAPIPWLALVAATWLVGATIFFVWHGAAHFRYVRDILAPPAQRARLDDGTTLVESDAATGPVAFGVLRRFVAVPRDFTARYDEDERRLALAHELGHHARGDLIANWVALAMLAIHWFNPLAWTAYRKFRADQEMANDARVLSHLPAMERHAYACAIVKAAHGRAVTAACHLHTIEDLKGRLRMLKANRKSRRVVLAGATGIAALTVAGLGLTASGAAAEKIRTVAAVQVPVLAAQVAPVEVPASVVAPDAPPVPPLTADMHHGRRIVISKDGKTETYEGADADAYIAAHPEFMARAPRPPHPPVPPMPGAAPVPPEAPALAFDEDIVVSRDGKRRVITRTGPGGTHSWAFNGPTVTSGDCGNKDKGSFVVHDQKDGKERTIICEMRIEKFAAAQAELGMKQARTGMAQARIGRDQALRGIEMSRRAIERDRNLSDEARQRAFAGLDSAKAEVEREMRDAQAD